MVARVRAKTETFEQYRDNLKNEVKIFKVKLGGRWFWRTFMPVHPQMLLADLPPKAQVFEFKEDTNVLVPSKAFNPSNVKQFVKFPPHVRQEEKPTRTGHKRREQIRNERAFRDNLEANLAGDTDRGEADI